MDRFDAMLAFVRVVQFSSFSQAAISLNMAKTTVSSQVSALERHLGVQLLNRTTRHVVPTEEGAAYYDRAVSLLSELEETEAATTASKAQPKGRLRVDMSPAVGHHIVIPALGSFVDSYPEITLEIGCNDRPVDLVSEGIDCVIRGNLIHDESLVARKLGTFDLAICASPKYLERFGTPKTPHELEEHQICRFFSSRSGRFFDYNFTKDGIRSSVRGRHRVAFNSIESCLHGAISGLGIVLSPLYLLEEHLQSGRLERILVDHQIDGIPVNLLYPQHRMLTSKLKAFRSWAEQLFAATKHVTPPN
ncbi:LysR family transcriptional regulator [Paraburkholderia pallida]|uniref:LysR family transcriptional regulator n=1 Tax=Paraburkholderia pallida TaxID=2547399 RepID=A0A4P7DB02_9BURK|nr:LysR family transcriptional regulator [Paraburkholderia pallida]QBR04325.1 LysR family transcriptional regulator [Paraburkholderia pallida]